VTHKPGNECAVASERISLRPDRLTRIVLMDDVREVRAALRTMIEVRFSNVEIVECENGDETWKIIQESPPDLLISDLTHPGLRLEEMLERLTAAQSLFPVLVVSAYGQGIVRLRERQQSSPGRPIGFLEKPILVESLQAEIERLVSTRASRCKTCPRVLLVDDEEFLVEMMKLAIVSKYDVALKSFTSSTAAWEELEQTDPDLLIVGGIMPQMSGEEIVRRLMERKSTYPILVVSGFLSEEVVRGWFPAASNITFLKKPFTLDQLRAELDKYLEPMPVGT